MQSYVDMKKGERGAWLSIAAYIILSAIKLMVGHFTHSEALSADGLNNATDVVASVAILIGLKISSRPPDRNHPYGHFRAETISAMIASFIMVTVGLQIIISKLKSLWTVSEFTSPDLISLWTALLCALVMYGVYRFNHKLSKEINSQALKAAAQDNRIDTLVSIGAAVGILGSFLGLGWLDPLAAVVIGFIICKTAWDIFRDASHTLTDGFDEQLLIDFSHSISEVSGVEKVVGVKARSHGNRILLDVVVQVDYSLNVIESHIITEDIEKRMELEHSIHDVHVHIEPMM